MFPTGAEEVRVKGQKLIFKKKKPFMYPRCRVLTILQRTK